MFKPATIEDARGRRVNLLIGLSSSAVREILSKQERKAFNEVMKDDYFGDENTSYTKARIVFNIIGIGAMFAFLLVIPFLFPLPGGRNIFYVWIGVGFGVVVIINAIVRIGIRMKSMRIDRPYAMKMMSLQRCPGCLYSLGELPAETDGCTVCPECGGAWKLP